MSSRLVRRSLVAASIACLVALPGTMPSTAAAASIDARAGCSVRGQETSMGPSYVTKLAVSSGVTCATGKSVIRAYDRCRKNNGGADGVCRSKVLTYNCTERRTTGRFQFSANATCKSGTKAVTFSYTQNL